MTTPPNRGSQRLPILSHASADDSSMRERVGGTNRAGSDAVGMNIALRSKSLSCEAE